MSPTRELTVLPPSSPLAATAAAPPLVNQAPAANFAWDEFFAASLRNQHTRTAYRRAVRQFFEWIQPHVAALTDITPALVGAYFDQHQGSPATKKLALAAIRGLFDRMVTRHVIVLNPAASVRGERYQVIEGKTPEITAEQARTLMKSIPTSRTVRFSDGETAVSLMVGLRDRAIIGVCIYTAARAGAVAKLRVKHLTWDGSQWTLRFEEKGGKSREIPVRHDLQVFLLDYVAAASLSGAPGDTPLFRSAYRTSGRLTANGISGVDVCRMVKHRLKDAGLPNRLSPHSFRVATITDLLTNGVALEDVQYLAGHANPRTTRLYDRRQKRHHQEYRRADYHLKGMTKSFGKLARQLRLREQRTKAKSPEISTAQANLLMHSINTTNKVGRGTEASSGCRAFTRVASDGCPEWYDGSGSGRHRPLRPVAQDTATETARLSPAHACRLGSAHHGVGQGLSKGE